MKLGMDALEQWDRPGSLDAAIKHFSNLAEQNPENAAAIAGLSIAYSVRYFGDQEDELWLKKSVASTQQAIKLNSQLALSHVAMGSALHQQNNLIEALKYQEQALRLETYNVFAMYGKISVLTTMHRYQEALVSVEEGMQKFPQNRSFADQKGVILNAMGDYVGAERAFRQSIAIQPDSIYAYANLASVMQYQGRMEDALLAIQQGLQIRPSNLLYTNLGNIYFYKGEYLRAVSAFEAALAPELGSATDYLSWANLADALLWIPGRKQEAIKYYNRAKQLLQTILVRRPNDAILVSRMALYSARVGNNEQCKVQLDNLLIEPSTFSDVYFRAGLAYELIGERQLALTQIIAAYNLGFPLMMIEAEPDLESLRRDPQYTLR